MREIGQSDDVERVDPADDSRADTPDRPYGAPVAAPEQPGVIRRPWSDLELPDDPDETPLGGPLTWARDAMDRAFSPSAIDHRQVVEVDHPDLPRQGERLRPGLSDKAG